MAAAGDACRVVTVTLEDVAHVDGLDHAFFPASCLCLIVNPTQVDRIHSTRMPTLLQFRRPRDAAKTAVVALPNGALVRGAHHYVFSTDADEHYAVYSIGPHLLCTTERIHTALGHPGHLMEGKSITPVMYI